MYDTQSSFTIEDALKMQTRGATLGSPGPTFSAGAFRNHHASFIGCFTVNIGIDIVFHAGFPAVMFAIEIAHNRSWRHLWWLETDSMLLMQAYESATMVPWKLRNRCNNCMVRLKDIQFILSYIYREGNCLVDKLASLGLSSIGFSWYIVLPCSVYFYI
jgi:hypothetical protein